MVKIASRDPILVFTVLDRDGREIGEIVHPKVVPTVGRGARTLLLVRDQPVTQTPLRAL